MNAPSAALLGALLLASPALAEDELPQLKAVEVYRSATVTPARVREEVGGLLQAYRRLRGESGRSAQRNAEKTRAKIEEKVRGLGDLAFVRLSYGEYVTSSDRSAYALFDVVDASDAGARMSFLPAPSGSVEDPKGLCAAWDAYAEMGKVLLQEGKLSTDHPHCPSHYCLWGSPTPELADYERRFVDGASRSFAQLQDVIRDHKDPSRRSAALYVLSYSTDSAAVVRTTTLALSDPAEEVRGAALQVLSDVALYRKGVFLEVHKIIPLLDDPLTGIRARALSVLVGLSNNPTYRPYVLSKGTPHLLRLLRLSDPSNHDLAFTILSLLSKEPHGRRDYAAWEAWAARQAPSPPREATSSK